MRDVLALLVLMMAGLGWTILVSLGIAWLAQRFGRRSTPNVDRDEYDTAECVDDPAAELDVIPTLREELITVPRKGVAQPEPDHYECFNAWHDRLPSQVCPRCARLFGLAA